MESVVVRGCATFDEQVQAIKEVAEAAGLLPLRSQAQLWDDILWERMDSLLPELMWETDIDMWIVMSEEFNNDGVLKTLLPSYMSVYAPRLAGLIFYFNTDIGHVERYCLYDSDILGGCMYEGVWDKAAGNQYDALRRLVESKNPGKIAINVGSRYAHCNGLALKLFLDTIAVLDEDFKSRIVSSEPLLVRWLETRTKREMEVYKILVKITRMVVNYTFCKDFIKPGVTTTTDVEWQMRRLIVEGGFDYWFGPDVDLQRAGVDNSRLSDTIILRGDIIHCDLGLVAKYIPLNTDMQQIAYVLMEGESDTPNGINDLFNVVKEFQSIVKNNFKKGLTGNEILLKSLEEAVSKGMEPMLYSHPIGYHGHGVGPCVGRYGHPGAVEGQGELTVNDNTCYALEHNICAALNEWGQQRVYMYIEEDICFNGQVEFIDGCQESIMLI